MSTSLWSQETLTRLEKEILPAYLPACRWFGGKGRAVRHLRIAHTAPLGRLAETRLLVLEVTFSEGVSESYVLPLSFVEAAAGEALGAATPHAIVTRGDDGRVLCDAIHLPEARAELLRLITHRVPGDGDDRFTGMAREDLDPILLEQALTDSRVIGADQSNTSVIYAEKWFLKLFRKFEPGPNPDLEVTRFLSETAGFTQVPAFLGALQFAGGVIALLTTFTPNQGDAWTFTLGAVADYFDRVLAAGATVPVAAVEKMIGTEYLDRARQLGERTAQMHLALASGEDRPEFAAEPFCAADRGALCAAMSEAAGRVLAHLREQEERLPESIRPAAAALAHSQRRIDASFARLTSHPIPAAKLRVHGDYHLGQVLNTGTDFVILDFEGEPRRSLRERRLKRSPLVDVAGMLRSFDYAGAAALRLRARADAERLEPWARAWVETVSERFLKTYLTLTAGASFLPPEAADVDLLLRVFILDKAIYEIGYELNYRPDFLPIPLGAVSRLLATGAET